MKTSAEIREMFLDFFEKKHNSTRVKSSSLVPDNPTILLTTAGMVQFMPYYLGLEKPPYNPPRAASCQKCARAGGKDSDIENVGRTPRHHTFFEMLGNFSFGDYYKKEVIPWAWEFVTDEKYLGLDKDRLWVTIFENDDEAFEIWRSVGVPADRILRKGKKDNFWGPPGASGSCGPCSEIHYDLGEHLKCSDNCSIATCECNRWVEIWNLVFTELFQDEHGNQSPLDKKNVDTGMGLERISMVCQGVESTFDTDLLKSIIEKTAQISGKKYKENEKTDISLRIVTDHARCVSFMIADGILPTNEGRGYVLRMILRRALRHGYLLGLELPFMAPVIDKVIENYGDVYTELVENRDKIQKVVLQEEERFKLTLQRGYNQIDDMLKKHVISGADAFKLYDTYGFPFELTKEIAEENGVAVNEAEFKIEMNNQKERARASMQKVVLTDDLSYTNNPDTKFVGYEENETTAKVLAIVADGKNVDSISEKYADVILDVTPFYAESGGQIGDCGQIGTSFSVEKTFKAGKVYVHRGFGTISKGDTVSAKIDTEKRSEIRKHHSLAHLLQAALIKVLGNEVRQAGSFVEADRTRFDFSFSRALTKNEIKQVENIINNWIKSSLKGETKVMDIESAKKSGATALFNEKYGDFVRVVSFSNGSTCISKELCGGTHVNNTLDLRLAKIVSESAISQGVRRIEILCSDSALNYLNEKTDFLCELAQTYKIKPDELGIKIEKLTDEIKEKNDQITDLESKITNAKFDTLLSRAIDIQIKNVSGKLFITLLEDIPKGALRFGIEMLAKRLGGEAVILLCSKNKEGGAILISKVTDNFVKTGISAGALVSRAAKAMGGNGGGKPNMAQGSAKDITNAVKILSEIENEIKTMQ
ncbi:MAG: alanine--tRNA ligase [Candidatus Gastranaerophilales bacterium]|nr:alanine--tRNA ligase [Candidatus Gastranaerophilales bacterium]